MRRLIRYRYEIVCVLIGLGVCVYNVMGYDDMNVLIHVMSPPVMFMNSNLFSENVMRVDEVPMWVYYVTTVLYWSVIGILVGRVVDWLRGGESGRSGLTGDRG